VRELGFLASAEVEHLRLTGCRAGREYGLGWLLRRNLASVAQLRWFEHPLALVQKVRGACACGIGEHAASAEGTVDPILFGHRGGSGGPDAERISCMY
jgi:hypothetical protein